MNHEKYMNFLLNALVGVHPDFYYLEHREAIESSARAVREVMRPLAATVWRGILLDPSETSGDILKPLPLITFLSFTEDREVAKGFADINHPISFRFKIESPHYKGYLIEHVAQPEEILFHHSWADRLGVGRYIDIEVVRNQKEVILNQNMRIFNLEAL